MKNILIFSGAGLSAESGISTFRDSGGTWYNHDPNVICDITNFDKNRELIFDFYNERRLQLATVKPNDAHVGIAELQKKYGDRVRIFTQNVDDLLERAGCKDVNHVHGFLSWMHCLKCSYAWHVGYAEVKLGTLCKKCSSDYIKPAIVFFNEPAPGYIKLFSLFGKSLGDVIVIIGTSGEVIPMHYVVGRRFARKKASKSLVVLNNKEKSLDGMIDYNLFDITIFKPASEAINEIKNIVDKFME